jgi:hypothetical protein
MVAHGTKLGYSASQLLQIGGLYHQVHIQPSIVGMTCHERNVLQRMDWKRPMRVSFSENVFESGNSGRYQS